MEIQQITTGKKRFIDLLLLADEQESMIDRYLERGEMFALFDNGLKSICVVTDEGNGCFEIKNLATEPRYQKKGYGKKLIRFLLDHYKCKGKTMFVGTGDCPMITSFYQKCGFVESHRVKNFFTDNYDHPIYESGIQLVDMVYFKREL